MTNEFLIKQQGKYLVSHTTKMGSFGFWYVILFRILTKAIGIQQLLSQVKWWWCLSIDPILVPTVSYAGSVVLTQTYPVAPYVCRTGNITLRCQYDGVENVLVVLWLIGTQATSNPSTIPGHTALPHTTTYQEVVVDSYINLATVYRCVPTLSNTSQLQSNLYTPQIECEYYMNIYHCSYTS